MLLGSFTKYSLFRVKCEVTSFLIWPWNTSMTSKAFWLGFPRIWRWAWTYGIITSSMTHIDSYVPLKCLELTLIENVSGNLNHGMLWFVVTHISVGLARNFRWNHECYRRTSITSRTYYSDRLWAFLCQGMVCALYILQRRLIKIHNKGAWNIMFFSKWCKCHEDRKTGLHFSPLWASRSFPLFFKRFTKPILRKRLSAQDDESKSTCFASLRIPVP